MATKKKTPSKPRNPSEIFHHNDLQEQYNEWRKKREYWHNDIPMNEFEACCALNIMPHITWNYDGLDSIKRIQFMTGKALNARKDTVFTAAGDFLKDGVKKELLRLGWRVVLTTKSNHGNYNVYMYHFPRKEYRRLQSKSTRSSTG